ncbi:PDZ domain-containing protein [Longimicrobium terrae]|uniref:Putative metalloprotease with PDZ domain n=1 Tax=Longimicrobium terrae TaxID=1639882 RepID=A0A841GVS3_9BACT|nr:putative metalloprotease with PDZ domain [Longimicrobium terrae]MBB6069015.1 putative metalloprotease with PDZ domain [Longimicrobium terrae]NNC28193.1 M61 family metallopeptidase [Longimicrobium terrae]
MARIRYRVRFPEPHTHMVGVELEAEGVTGPSRLVMPSWTPGSYLMREFARNVMHMEAADGSWRPLAVRKADRGSWEVDAPADGVLRARWVVNADELTVRTSHVDATHAAINGASVFAYLEGRTDEPVEIAVEPPAGWRITTAMEPAGENVFTAADYDELVDSPLEIGTHRVLEWEVDGVPHRYAVWGRGNDDPARLVADTTRIVQAERDLWGGLPYPHFTFILHLASGQGGLEHRNSTALLVDRFSFRGMGYESVLGLVAHELFHAWNGKRLRPEVLGPFDYTREAYTRELWVVEGFTTYYTDLVLRRAGLITPQRYLDKLAEMITRFQQQPGRGVQPLEESSFDTWIKFYRPDANSPNATISYYQKGALVALLLDMAIREHTGNARSLDDVMRLLWERWGARDVGFPEGTVQAVLSEVAGTDLSPVLVPMLRGTGELDFGGLLRTTGVMLSRAEPYAGPGMAGLPAPPPPREPETGMQLRVEGGRLVVAHVLAGSAGWRAGVNAGDELVAVNGFRITSPDTLQQRVLEAAPGSTLDLTVFRRDELVTVRLPAVTVPPSRLVLRAVKDATPAQQAVLADWLRTTVPAAPAAQPGATSL